MATAKSLLAGGLVVVLAVVAAGGAVAFWLTAPIEVGEQRFLDIERGTSTRGIANQLAQEGLVRSPYAFLLARAIHPGTRLQAGEYEFDGTVSAWQIFDKIRLGKVFYREITIPEGSNLFDIAALLRRSEILPVDDFMAAAKDPAAIRDLDPLAPDLEGYLFPSTYRLTGKATAKELCHLMTAEFRKQWAAALAARQISASETHRIVTLASLVEKETAVPQERPLVAAVFENRLKLHIPLQCDPSTIYAALLENRYKNVIHKSDLASTNPYNTYAHAGLPPGPIANPGALSLKAALDPSSSRALYFVAKGDGSGHHTFSETLAEHEAAVAHFRKVSH